jgi:hypothetical protein
LPKLQNECQNVVRREERILREEVDILLSDIISKGKFASRMSEEKINFEYNLLRNCTCLPVEDWFRNRREQDVILVAVICGLFSFSRNCARIESSQRKTDSS